MSYPQASVNAVINALNKYGITGKVIQAAILAVMEKESGLVPKRESLYYSTPERIVSTFPSHFPTVASAVPYVANSEKLANFVYANRLGNGSEASGDGFRYRGAGLNQITFKNAFQSYGSRIGRDLVNSPDLMNDVNVAAEVAALYFVDQFKSGASHIQQIAGTTDVNAITDTTKASQIAVQANAGWGTNFNNAIVQEGYQKVLASINGFLVATTNFVKKNPLPVIAGFVFFLGLMYLVFSHKKEIIKAV